MFKRIAVVAATGAVIYLAVLDAFYGRAGDVLVHISNNIDDQES